MPSRWPAPGAHQHYITIIHHHQYYINTASTIITSTNVIIIISPVLYHQYFTHCVESALGFACGKGLMYAAFPGRQRALPPLLSRGHPSVPGRRWCVPQALLSDSGGSLALRRLRRDSLALSGLPTQLPGLEHLPGHKILSSGRPPHCRAAARSTSEKKGWAALGWAALG